VDVDTTLRAIVAAILGLAIGSFLTVVVDRVPKKESIVSPRSRCPHCGAEIRNRDNIPVLSWLMLRGRCRDCGTHIPVRYPLLEAGTAATFAGVAIVYTNLYLIVMLCAFCAVMLAVGFIDLEHRIIPNKITYPAFPAFALAIVIGWAIGRELDPPRAIIGALAYGGVFFVIAFIAPRGLGMGDVKLTGLIGLVLGALGLRLVGVAAGAAVLLGGVAGIVALVAGRGRKSAMPFGPSLSAGALIAVFWGERIASWYLRSIT
jgi:leader peptidase (prepilin peptidase) / N-methyltransferase